MAWGRGGAGGLGGAFAAGFFGGPTVNNHDGEKPDEKGEEK